MKRLIQKQSFLWGIFDSAEQKIIKKILKEKKIPSDINKEDLNVEIMNAVLETNPSILESFLAIDMVPDEDTQKQLVSENTNCFKMLEKYFLQKDGDGTSTDVQITAIKTNPIAVGELRVPTKETIVYILKNDLSHYMHNFDNYIIENNLIEYLMKEVPEEKEYLVETYIRSGEGAVFYRNYTHDIENRNQALVFMYGKFYTGETHSECIAQATAEKGNNVMEDKNLFNRPTGDFMESNFGEDVYFFGNIVDDKNDGSGKEKCIYIVNKPETINGISIEEAATLTKQQFPEYEIYNDDTGFIDVDNFTISYTRLARLKKKTLYHTTSLQNWLQIKEDGYLIPQGSEGAGINYTDPTKEELTYFQNMVFFSTNIEEAKNYGSYFEKPYVILECEISQSKLLADKSDCEECETWQESMEKTEQVAVRGKVSIDCVTNVYQIRK